MNLGKVTLKPAKDKSIKRFHPWIFSNAIKEIEKGVKDGNAVEVFSNKGKYLGTGHYQQETLCIRIFEFRQQAIDEKYWKLKIELAINNRKEFIDNANTTIFRLIHAEGDDLSGLIIDFYNGTAVIQCHSIGMWLIKDLICNILRERFPNLDAIYDKSSDSLDQKYQTNYSIENTYLFGNDLNKTPAKENNNSFSINWINGQKTGFFIDQRENRKLLGELSKDKKILNTFCYSGGFSIYALNNGAKEVHSLDSSKKAIDLLEENIALIKNKKIKHKSIVADAMEYIKNINEDYDIIILDPPAFAKHMSAKHKAIQGYKRLNSRAIEQIKPGGIIFTFSCSQVISKELFRNTILSVGIALERKIKILHQLHQPPDHPINIFHPESEYLKGLVIQVF
jgi:23S rRNA (cytosine1962-C5)-methyltransferase